jgi:hypothetical protein
MVDPDMLAGAKTGHHDRHVAIVLSGFTKNPHAVVDDVGCGDVEVVAVGDLVGQRPSTKNRITWRRAIFNDDTWDYGFDALVARLGGPAKLKAILHHIEPTAAWLRVSVPSVGSPWQESGGLHLATLAQLVEIGLGMDVAVFAYDAANPTHGLRPAPQHP